MARQFLEVEGARPRHGVHARASKGSGQEERPELGPLSRSGERTLEGFGRGLAHALFRRAHVPNPSSSYALTAPHAGTSGCGGWTPTLQSSGQDVL